MPRLSLADRRFLHTTARVLVLGAGGLGCEMLRCLAMSGVGHIDIVDMDTVELSNLNRQLLFTLEDIGRAKATTAAEAIMNQMPHIEAVAHVGRIESYPPSFYRQFHAIVSGLDSLEARRWINSLLCHQVTFTHGQADMQSIIPLVDGGSEGLKGHVRVIVPSLTACFECTLDLFPPTRTTFPLCTLAGKPRLPEHCIEWAWILHWPKTHPKDFDAGCAAHLQWVLDEATKRAHEHAISGVTRQLVADVVRNTVPAVASTNALIAALCVREVVSLLTNTSSGHENFVFYNGQDGVYAVAASQERCNDCPVCSGREKCIKSV